jgi:hypothetical protein
MMGGELRKSRRPLAATLFKTPSRFRRASLKSRSGVKSKNISLKGLTRFIERNVSNNPRSGGILVSAVAPTRITSSENLGEVIVENAFMTMV